MARRTTKRTVSAVRETAAPAEPLDGVPTHQDIASRAYEVFLERGGEHGHDWDDWLSAERELRSQKFESV